MTPGWLLLWERCPGVTVRRGGARLPDYPPAAAYGPAMGRSRHRAAVPSEVMAVVAALVLSGVLALIVAFAASGTVLRVGVVLCTLMAVTSGAIALVTGRGLVSKVRAEMSRERAGRTREVDALQRHLVDVEQRAHQLSIRADSDRARMTALAADLLRMRRPAEHVRPTLLLPLLTEAINRAAPLPLARVRVRMDDASAVAAALAPPVALRPHRAIVGELSLVGEFSLIGLAAFPRPAGMPDPGLPLIAPVAQRPKPDQIVIPDANEVIDLRDADDRSLREA